MPNSYSRLNADFNQARMFATSEELTNFKGKIRTAVIVGDYYYEMEDWDKAFDIYTYYDRKFGDKLNLRARAYMDYDLGNLYLIKENDKKGLEYLSKFEGKKYECAKRSWHT